MLCLKLSIFLFIGLLLSVSKGYIVQWPIPYVDSNGNSQLGRTQNDVKPSPIDCYNIPELGIPSVDTSDAVPIGFIVFSSIDAADFDDPNLVGYPPYAIALWPDMDCLSSSGMPLAVVALWGETGTQFFDFERVISPALMEVGARSFQAVEYDENDLLWEAYTLGGKLESGDAYIIADGQGKLFRGIIKEPLHLAAPDLGTQPSKLQISDAYFGGLGSPILAEEQGSPALVETGEGQEGLGASQEEDLPSPNTAAVLESSPERALLESDEREDEMEGESGGDGDMELESDDDDDYSQTLGGTDNQRIDFDDVDFNALADDIENLVNPGMPENYHRIIRELEEMSDHLFPIGWNPNIYKVEKKSKERSKLFG
ncbi:hypothetical protein ABW19_dt0208313 [Dactylella cylindrospora]|nr:hypothetical protein ABW19_dt0208313 [Dactylella cylindrospora]